jgi:hypothetical protein
MGQEQDTGETNYTQALGLSSAVPHTCEKPGGSPALTTRAHTLE